MLIQNYNIYTQIILVNETSMLVFLIKSLLHYLVIIILFSHYYNKLIFSNFGITPFVSWKVRIWVYFESGINHFVFKSKYWKFCTFKCLEKVDTNFREGLLIFIVWDIFLSINNFAQTLTNRHCVLCHFQSKQFIKKLILLIFDLC